MSRMDPECFPQDTKNSTTVCPECFDNADLSSRIKDGGEPGTCTYCDTERASVLPLHEIARFIEDRMSAFHSKAAENLPWEGREGGYQAPHYDTAECLFASMELELAGPGSVRLEHDLLGELGDDVWCEYDWLALEYDRSLESSWEEFCSTVKSHRRFFFHRIGEGQHGHPDERSIFQFLEELAQLIEDVGAIKTVDSEFTLYRARPTGPGEQFKRAAELGPPPSNIATQSNRMNPPGIPMFYGADNLALAVAETRATEASVGRFQATRAVRLIDLEGIPSVPGLFSEATRREIQGLQFLHRLSAIIAEPVARDNRVNVDYIPTQIVAEYLRDKQFSDGSVDGVQYKSALDLDGANVVLFATADDVCEIDVEPVNGAAWIKLIEVVAHKK